SPPTPTPQATLTPTLEPLNEDELISEWQQSGYVDLQGLDPSEAMRRLDVLQDGYENEGRVLFLPDEYRVLLMGVRLANVYQHHVSSTREIRGFDLQDFVLEIIEDDRLMPWYPGL